MGLYYQAVMDKSKLTKANKLYNKIENRKSEKGNRVYFQVWDGGKYTDNEPLRFLFSYQRGYGENLFSAYKRKNGKGVGRVRAIIFWTLAYFWDKNTIFAIVIINW